MPSEIRTRRHRPQEMRVAKESFFTTSHKPAKDLQQDTAMRWTDASVFSCHLLNARTTRDMFQY